MALDPSFWNTALQLGIAQGAGTAGNSITNGVILQGMDDAQSGRKHAELRHALFLRRMVI